MRSGVDVRGKTAVILVRPLDEGFSASSGSGSRCQGPGSRVQGGLRILAENDASDMPVLVSLSRNDLQPLQWLATKTIIASLCLLAGSRLSLP